MNWLKATIKRIKSYFKKDWDFKDYPIETWRNPNARQDNVRYGAGIIYWSGMIGHGETVKQAIEQLENSFTLYKNEEKLPRPGTKVPFRFVTTEQIDKYEAIAVDYFKRVLNMDYYGGFYSDGSSLNNFEPFDGEEARSLKEDIIRKTMLLYNIDVTEIYDGPLWEVFKAIRDRQG